MKPKPILTLVLLLTFTLTTAFFAPPSRADGDEDDDPKAVEEEEGAGGAIPVAEFDRIKALVKKAAIVHGKISEVKTFKTSGHALLKFEGSEVAVFIRKESLDEDLPWFLDQRVGKEVYVAGQVKMFRDQLEIVIVSPKQISDSPNGFDLANIPLPETTKKSSSTTKKKKPTAVKGAFTPGNKDLPDLPLLLEESSVQTVVFYIRDTGMKVKEDPYSLPRDYLDTTVAPVTATVTKAEGTGPMQVVFKKPDDGSKKEIQTVIDLLAEHYGKWPQDKVLTFDVDFDSREFFDDPSSLVIVGLVDSLVTGKPLAPNLVIMGDLADDGSTVAPRGNVDSELPLSKVIKAVSEAAGEGARLVCSEISIEQLNDLALDGDWEALAGVTALMAPTMKDALQLMFPEPGGELETALAGFDQAQGVIKKSGSGMVKNSHVQQRVMAAGKAWSKNISAGYYAFYARGKVPRSYSLPYTFHVINELHNKLRFMQLAPPPEPKDRLREIATKLKEMKPKIHPDLSKLIRGISDFESEVSSSVLRPRDGRAKERQEEKIKKTDEEVSAELKALETKISGGGGEDVFGDE